MGFLSDVFDQGQGTVQDTQSPLVAKIAELKSRIAEVRAGIAAKGLGQYADGGMVAPYGLRQDGTPKGANGFLGPLKRPDGSISTELAVGVEFDGKETQIPLLVPTLDKTEVDHLLGGGKPTDAIVNKAVEHAIQRMNDGMSPFMD